MIWNILDDNLSPPVGEHQSWPFWDRLSCKCQYTGWWRKSPDPEEWGQHCNLLSSPNSPTHLGSSLDKTSQAEDDGSLVLLDHLDTHVERERNSGRHWRKYFVKIFQFLSCFNKPRSKERPAMRTAQMVWPLPASPAAESVRLEGTRYKDSALPCSANSTLSLTELQHSERFCIKSFFLASTLFFWTTLLSSSATVNRLTIDNELLANDTTI